MTNPNRMEGVSCRSQRARGIRHPPLALNVIDTLGIPEGIQTQSRLSIRSIPSLRKCGFAA
jgi:hypothetical protein